MELFEVQENLRKIANPEKAEFKATKFGIPANNALGLYMADLNQMAKEIGWDSKLAIELMNQEIYEGKLLASKIFKPKELTLELVDTWVKQFDTWEICDAFSMTVFARSKHANEIILKYAQHPEEMMKRTSYATLAGLCSHDKNSDNQLFMNYIPLLSEASTDNRNFVKKAVSWAARSIGKRNPDLRESVIGWAKSLSENSNAKWVVQDVLKELEMPNIRVSNYPRKIYGKPKKMV
jgi:3-methyladenine DNA glycosylase AlkD